MERLKDEFISRMNEFIEKMTNFIPDLLVMIVIVAAGLIVAWAVKLAATRIFSVIKFDDWADETGISSALHNAGIRKPPSAFIKLSVYWLIVVTFFMAGFASLGLKVTDTLASLFFMYLPRFFSAVLIITFGYLFAVFVSRAALLAAVNAGIEYSRLIAAAVRLFIIILVFAMALEQLSIAPRIVFAAFSIFFGGISLGLAIAFGYGGRGIAKKLLEYIVKKETEKDDINML